MGENKKKSKRKWEYSGYKICHECKNYHYDTWTSMRPHKLVLCRSCYDWIYVQDRKPLTLLDEIKGEE